MCTVHREETASGTVPHKVEILLIVERVKKKQKERETEAERDTKRERGGRGGAVSEERESEGGVERERE